jgi:adenylate cyclase, class 2
VREMEVKFRVDDLEGILAALKARGIEVSDPLRQDDQACLEYETEVADREAMHQAVLQMGYRPTVRIIKTRRTASIGGCSLCIDEVEGAGGFVEAERMVPDDADAQAIQAELAMLIESLGAGTTRTAETYDSLVHAVQDISG